MPAVSKRAAAREAANFKMAPSGLWEPQQTELVASRFVSRYERTPEDLLKVGAQFYPTWREDAEHIGNVIGRGHEAGAAVAAHLSPQNESEMNRIQALQMVHGLNDKQVSALQGAGHHSAQAVGAKSRMETALKNGDSREHAKWHAEYSAHQHEVKRLRLESRIEGTPLGMLGNREIAHALSVVTGQEKDPLGSLGPIKRGDFGRLIADPQGYERVPIDTHYHDVGVGRLDLPYQVNRGLEAVTRYEAFQGAHTQALGAIRETHGADLRSGDVMGGIWYGHRAAKQAALMESSRSDKASQTKLRNVRQNFPQWAPETHGLRPTVGAMPTGR